MAWVKFRAEWLRKGVVIAPNDVLELEEWEAAQVIALGKAKPCEAPPVAMPEPTDAELLDAAMGEDEPEPMQFKSGTVPDDAPMPTTRAGRKPK